MVACRSHREGMILLLMEESQSKATGFDILDWAQSTLGNDCSQANLEATNTKSSIARICYEVFEKFAALKLSTPQPDKLAISPAISTSCSIRYLPQRKRSVYNRSY